MSLVLKGFAGNLFFFRMTPRTIRNRGFVPSHEVNNGKEEKEKQRGMIEQILFNRVCALLKQYHSNINLLLHLYSGL